MYSGIEIYKALMLLYINSPRIYARTSSTEQKPEGMLSYVVLLKTCFVLTCTVIALPTSDDYPQGM